MNNQMNLHMELLEDVTAPGDARDFVEGVTWGLGAVAAATAIIAFT
ncbi:daptide-type RiPP [Paenibacillus xanthanilyticus]|uniref:Daptide-type RiPP n=1 Tax=Paenibacillus xanthanilyticus TaxID=1783531 RepID=A0ABV8JU57_9BACL